MRNCCSQPLLLNDAQPSVAAPAVAKARHGTAALEMKRSRIGISRLSRLLTTCIYSVFTCTTLFWTGPCPQGSKIKQLLIQHVKSQKCWTCWDKSHQTEGRCIVPVNTGLRKTGRNICLNSAQNNGLNPNSGPYMLKIRPKQDGSRCEQSFSSCLAPWPGANTSLLNLFRRHLLLLLVHTLVLSC